MTTENIIYNLVIGIAAGSLWTIILVTLASLFKNSILPWYRNKVFKGLDISGEWHVVGELICQKIKINLSQHAQKVTGDAIFVDLREGRSHNTLRTFNIKGIIKERFIVLTLEAKDKQTIGIATYLVEAVGDGRTLKGSFSTYSVDGCKIISDNHTFLRDKEVASKLAKDAKEQREERKDAQMEFKKFGSEVFEKGLMSIASSVSEEEDDEELVESKES